MSNEQTCVLINYILQNLEDSLELVKKELREKGIGTIEKDFLDRDYIHIEQLEPLYAEIGKIRSLVEALEGKL